MAVNRVSPPPSDLDIAQSATIKPILQIAGKYGISDDLIIPYGREKGKIRLEALESLKKTHAGKYIDVTAITPTPLGEGKTTTTIGLTEGLAFLGHKAVCAIRQPSMGPTFGIKGGAAGGGYSQIVPMEEFNLHLTGDLHAVSAAHNLGAAALDARIYHESRWGDAFLAKQGLTRLNPDPYAILWRRVVDMNDRALRNIMVGMGGLGDGPLRQSGFDITVASELMAILALSTSLKDMRLRIGRMVMALDKQGKALTAEDFGVAGAMTVLLKDALMPNLMQTMEEQGALVHTGPFANIAHGNSSVIADKMGIQMADYLVTESGFGSDVGMEKFFHIKCRTSGMRPDAVVLVATVRALKMHGGGPKVTPGKDLDPVYKEKNLELLRKGCANMVTHIQTAGKFAVPVVVAINVFPTDDPEEWKIIKEEALAAGASDAVISRHWELGGEGAADLAAAVIKAADSPSKFRFLYELNSSVKEKIEVLATEVYKASKVEYSPEAERKIKIYSEMGHDQLPICMAKTQYSLSHNPLWKNVPPRDIPSRWRISDSAQGPDFCTPWQAIL
ncbi:formate--tetrahydrofolate ligase [Oceanispirochaeta crateris]|uniref:formate--tetrahydrofolate ligase n=1 Tax=Oceanispirochaeta crateris TaxID=2518645 RepID=UPI002482C6CD|nr:formate--tetrahydrofolate ligase [Oceanispirochaeta crateris]